MSLVLFAVAGFALGVLLGVAIVAVFDVDAWSESTEFRLERDDAVDLRYSMKGGAVGASYDILSEDVTVYLPNAYDDEYNEGPKWIDVVLTHEQYMLHELTHHCEVEYTTDDGHSDRWCRFLLPIVEESVDSVQEGTVRAFDLVDEEQL